MNKGYKMIQIPECEYNILKTYCIQNDKKISKVICRLIKEYLYNNDVKNELKRDLFKLKVE